MAPNAQIPRLVFTSRPYLLQSSSTFTDVCAIPAGE
jgi:hypothetical protein